MDRNDIGIARLCINTDRFIRMLVVIKTFQKISSIIHEFTSLMGSQVQGRLLVKCWAWDEFLSGELR